MAIVKTNIPMTSQENWKTAQKLAQRYPSIRTENLVWSAFGRPIPVMTLGTGRRKVLFSASHHANEWITTPVLLKFLEQLADAAESDSLLAGKSAAQLLRDTTIVAVPMVNPDGVDLVTGAISAGSPQYERAEALALNYPGIPFPEGWKANLNGVDLNLQYPAGWLQARNLKFEKGYRQPGPRDFVGQAPLNQRESLQMARLTEQLAPDLLLALHSQGQVIYWQFENYMVPGARELGEKMAQASGYALADTPFFSSFAGFKDWFIKAFRRPGYTVEVGVGENPLPISQFDEIYENVLGALLVAAAGT